MFQWVKQKHVQFIYIVWNSSMILAWSTKTDETQKCHFFVVVMEPPHSRLMDIYSNNLVSCVPTVGSKFLLNHAVTVSEIDSINDDCNRWWWCRPHSNVWKRKSKWEHILLRVVVPFGGACAIWPLSYGERSQIVKVLFFTFQQSYTHTSVYKR